MIRSKTEKCVKERRKKISWIRKLHAQKIVRMRVGRILVREDVFDSDVTSS
jgi:hypothetical protein